MFLFGVNPSTKPIAESFISTKEIVNAFSSQITECKNPAQNYGHSFVFLLITHHRKLSNLFDIMHFDNDLLPS